MLSVERHASEARGERGGAHDVALPGGDWRVWRTVALRGAGFAASLPLALSGDRAAASADRLLEAEAVVKRWEGAALAELATASGAGDVETLRARRAARRKLRKGIVRAEGSESERALTHALEQRAAAQAAFVAMYDADVAAAEEQLRAIASDPRLEEALLWQNHQAVRVALRRVSERHGSPKDRRNAEAFIAMKVQRYSVKNDTVGFFGPLGWASITDAPHAIDVVPGPDLLEHRQVYFEGWCIDALAAALDARPGIRPWTAPRRKAGVWMDTERVYAPLMGPVATTYGERKVLAACEGARTAAEIARSLLADAGSGFRAEAEIFDILHRLVSRNLVAWRLEVAPQLHPEVDLASRIDRIGDAAVRATCREALDALVAARDGAAAAVGRPAELEARLEHLEHTFTRVTGVPPTRRAGETYAARGLVYEDCRRAGDVTLGREFLSRVGPALSTVLDGAQWVAAEMARVANGHFRRCQAELRKTGGNAVDGHLFYSYVRAKAAETIPLLATEIGRRFQERWQSILGVDYAERRCWRPISEVAARARDVFAPAGPSWSQAEYISPDLMVAARGADALRRGEFHCVLGEVHGTNTLMTSALFAQHPWPAETIAAIAAETRHETYVHTQQTKQEWIARANLLAIPPTFWRYEYGDDLPSLPAHRSLPAAMLVAVDRGDVIRMRARDGSVEFDALEIFGHGLCLELHRILGQLAPAVPHVPRVTIGDLTISRERWSVTASEIAWPEQGGRAAAFVAIREWASRHGLPRHVFYKSPTERKPCYLDLDSPIYVNVFAKTLRHLDPDAPVRIVEMLPRIDETWLVDINGTTYTSELRLVARRPGSRP